MPLDASTLLGLLSTKAAESTEPDALGAVLVDALRQALPQASWIGIYWLEGDELVLGPFVGPPTEHVRIPVGSGVCGTAVAERRDMNVPDVGAIGNYLACNLYTKSELVVLIRRGDHILGQIDIDSDVPNGFGEREYADVKTIADALAVLL